MEREALAICFLTVKGDSIAALFPGFLSLAPILVGIPAFVAAATVPWHGAGLFWYQGNQWFPKYCLPAYLY